MVQIAGYLRLSARSTAALIAAAALGAWAKQIDVAGRVWEVPDHATLDGTILTLRADGPSVPGGRRNATATTSVDLSPFIESGGVEWHIRAKCVGIEKPEKPWYGLKAMLSFKDSSGAMKYPGPGGRLGDFGWYTYRHRASLAGGVDGPATFTIGLQEAKGEVSYDLASLEFFPFESVLPPDDPSLQCEYSGPGLGFSAGEERTPLRGFMLPSRGLHDEDFAKLASWGVTLVRYQMSRNWPYADTERDIADYDEWMEVKLSHLEERVVPFASKYGIKVIVDLHMPPGGRSADHELNMFYDPVYAEHFVDLWRGIAMRFKGSPAIVAYDLVNEPHQTYHAVAGNDNASLQLRAAEAIREIDPDIALVMEPIHAASPQGFESLAAVPLKDVYYELHVYQPFAFSHQGVSQGKPWEKTHWPDPEQGWDKNFLREKLAPVLDFQRRHGARIFVGEFSAVAWAEGAGDYLRDCISLFEEYGWDWTYHAFDEWAGWSIEHEPIEHGITPDFFRRSDDNPRRRAILDGLAGRIVPEPSAPAAVTDGGEGPKPAGADTRPWGMTLDWKLPPQAHIDGSVLVVDIPESDTNRFVHCEAHLDLSDIFNQGLGARADCMVRGEGVSLPDTPWNGVKFMLSYVDDSTGRVRWPGASFTTGDFDWTNAAVRIGGLVAPAGIRGGKATLILGMQGCYGHAEFDLASLRIEAEDAGVPIVNQDWVVKYPHGTDTPRTRRGFMLPGRPTTEDDISTMASWGTTLARFQITRNWNKINDNRDIEEYRRWIDWRLDNLVNVLDWAAKYGMQICIDLHQPPGGKRGVFRPEEMNMFHEDEYAEEFVQTWRRIASRVKGHPAIYGYDLVNEPVQRGPVRNNYWELQRRAAQVVREIDPDTPIIVESNLSDGAAAFRYLSPLAMDNVIYEVHMYEPLEFTHQGIGSRPRLLEGRAITWPGRWHGETWNQDFLRRAFAPVLEFQRKHKCRIYVGEFSAACWAPGAEKYLSDVISLCEEYGWDWTYHAFREAPFWSIEHAGNDRDSIVPSDDNPRRTVLLDALSR